MIIDQDLGVVKNPRFIDRFNEDKYFNTYSETHRHDLSPVEINRFHKDKSEALQVVRKQKSKMMHQLATQMKNLPKQSREQIGLEYKKSLKFYPNRNCPITSFPINMSAQENTGIVFWIRKQKDKMRKYKIGREEHWMDLTIDQKVKQQKDLTNLFLREMGHNV